MVDTYHNGHDKENSVTKNSDGTSVEIGQRFMFTILGGVAKHNLQWRSQKLPNMYFLTQSQIIIRFLNKLTLVLSTLPLNYAITAVLTYESPENY